MAGPVSSINWGARITAPVIDVYLVPTGQTANYTYQGRPYAFASDGWNAYEAQQVDLALSLISDVANVQFRYSPSQSGAEMVLITDFDPDVFFAGLMIPPGQPLAGLAAFNHNSIGWDENSPGAGGLERGGEAFKTILHEIGHGLGLAHPHDRGGGSTVMQGVSSPFFDYGKAGLNQGIFTIMSYNSSWQTNPDGLPTVLGTNYGLEGSMMALDIAALQGKYGANMSHATGNDVYVLPSSNGVGTFYSCIWDAGGIDEIRANASSASVIDLRPATLKYAPGGGGYVSYSQNIKGGFTIAAGAVIENATGSQLGDTLIGNGVDNVLQGLGGDDRLFGLGGIDLLDGGNGNDFLRGGGGNDELYGGNGNDSLRGDAGNDHLYLGTGADVAIGGAGHDNFYLGLYDGLDKVDGGGGIDTLRFDLDNSGHLVVARNGLVLVDGAVAARGVERMVAQGGDGIDIMRGDRLGDILSGGNGDDALAGRNGNDQLLGEGGNDRIGGGNGNDLLNGGTGDDIVAGNGGNDLLHGEAGNDLLVGHNGRDRLFGGDGDDILGGGGQNDQLFGGAGNDRLVGGGGRDLLVGEGGDDLLIGGQGADVFLFTSLAGTDTVADFRREDAARFATSDLASFAEFRAAATEVGGDTVLALASGTVVFSGLSISDFSADQFDFI